MATQVLSAQVPPWLLVHDIRDLPGTPFDAIDMATLWFSKVVVSVPESLEGTPPPLTPESNDSEVVCSSMEVLPVAFAPAKVDPVYKPVQNDSSRNTLFLKFPDEQRTSRLVFATDIDSGLFRGFLRSMVADRPFFDPCGPPEWLTEYYAVFEICRRIYVQKFTQEGHSMLYRMRIRDKGEVAELRTLTESVIGQPSVYNYRTVRIFEETTPYCETDFSPLPPSRPFCGRPTDVPHRPKCLCPIHWPNVTITLRACTDGDVVRQPPQRVTSPLVEGIPPVQSAYPRKLSKKGANRS